MGAKVPLWVIVSSSIAALPALFLAKSHFDYWGNERKARALGGRLVPKVPTNWIGGIDLLATLIDVYKTGYLGKLRARRARGGAFVDLPLGDGIVDWLAESGGQTVDMRSLWASHVRCSHLRLARPSSPIWP